MILTFLLVIITSAFVSGVITPLTRNFLVKRNLVEDPALKQQKTHNATALYPIPRGGGLPIFIAIITSLLFFIPIDKHLLGIIFASFITLLVGLWDDLKDISPKVRLLTNILASLIVVASGIGIAYISNPFGGILDLSFIRLNFTFLGNHSIWLIPDLLAIVWIIWCMNIVGWSAGVEGQLPGFVVISAIFIGILGLKYSSDITQWPLIILSGAIAGAYLGFLPYNFFPQSIMPGYSGKSLAGFLLAVLAILSGAKLATLILLLGIPMIDAVFVLSRRLIHRRPLLLSDGYHFHHRLLAIGWSRPTIAIFYWSISLSLGVISLFLNSQQKFYALFGVFFLFIGFVLKVYRRT